MRLTTLKPRLATLDTRRVAVQQGTERLRGTTWRNIRDRIMRRDAGLCQVCKEAGRLSVAAQVDHKVPLFMGGSNDDSNLQAICDPCHTAKSAQEATNRAIGAIPA